MDVSVVELLPHLPQLTHGVVQVTFTLTPAGEGPEHVSQVRSQVALGRPGVTPVVEGDPRGGLLLAEEGRRLHLGVAEAQVLVEVIQAIDKVAYMTPEHLKINVVTECTLI